MSENELIRAEPQTQLSVSQMTDQVHQIQELMRSLMKDGEHYGVIPGTNSKKTLLKPGAEKLCMMFRFAPEYQVDRRDMGDKHVEYEVICRLTHIPTGRFVGSGVGLCSTMESKYRWRGGSHLCPECGKACIIKGKAEYGGGWICFKKKGGCGAKFPDHQFKGEAEKIENPDISDTLNTVLKMAKKRALVDAAITATAASDIFTQDVGDPEDDPAHDHETPLDDRRTVHKPEPKPQTSVKTGSPQFESLKTMLVEIGVKPGDQDTADAVCKRWGGHTISQCWKDSEAAHRVQDALLGCGLSHEEILSEALAVPTA